MKISLRILGVLALVIILALSAKTYNASALSYEYSYRQLNKYWQDHLTIFPLNDELGAHYWESSYIYRPTKTGEIVRKKHEDGSFADDEHVRYLPDDVGGSVKYIDAKGLVATDRALYHWDNAEDEWHVVLPSFNVWHRAVNYKDRENLVIGEYGHRIYSVDLKTKKSTILHTKPEATRHFHFTSIDPYSGYIYTSLGDTHKALETGLMFSSDEGRTWKWLHRTRRGFESTHRQPTAVYFEPDRIIFGTDSSPDGVFSFDKATNSFSQSYFMPDILKSWFTDIRKVGEVYWGVSRSFGQKPRFGVLWASVDAKQWYPIQVLDQTPMWIEENGSGVLSIGFTSGPGLILTVPDKSAMSALLLDSPPLTLSQFDRFSIRFSRMWIDFFKDVLRLVYRS